MTLKTQPFDPVKHLDNPEVIRAYVEECHAQIARLCAALEPLARCADVMSIYPDVVVVSREHLLAARRALEGK